MSDTKEIELLADIASLLKKYGLEPFEQLAQNVRDGRFVDDLLLILDASARTGRRSKASLGKKGPPTKKKDGITQFLQRIEKEDPQKANMLKQLHHGLVGKSILPTLKDIRHFAEDNGLKPIKATTRDKAILSFLRDLSSFPIDRISRIISNMPHVEQGGGRTLEGWADVILRDRGKDTND